MRRKLLLVNLTLAALAMAGLWKLRVDYRRARERYQILRPVAVPAAAASHLPPLSGLPPVQPATYLDAAEKFLLSQDRNANVVVEPPKVKPRPALPQLFGVLTLGGSPIAIMAAAPSAPHKTVRVGETIGEFKLLAAAGDRITLEWEGQTIEAQVSDVLARPSGAETASGAGPGAPGMPSGTNSGSGPNVINPNASARPGEFLIGAPMQGAGGSTIYISPPGDSAPQGTVYQGKRKVVRQTPFGTQSWWEDVRP